MCLAIPMQVLEAGETVALCEGRNGRRMINVMLVGKVEPGQWLMTFFDAAREIVDAEQAALVDAALDGLQTVLDGGEIDMARHFPDLASQPNFLEKDKV